MAKATAVANSKSVAEQIRDTTVKLLQKEGKHNGSGAKMDWLDYERIMTESLDFPVNRGFLFGLLLVKKFGRVKVTLELLPEPKPLPKKRRKKA